MDAPTLTVSGSKITCVLDVVIKISCMHVNLGRIHVPRLCEFVRTWLELEGHGQKVAKQRRVLSEKVNCGFILSRMGTDTM